MPRGLVGFLETGRALIRRVAQHVPERALSPQGPRGAGADPRHGQSAGEGAQRAPVFGVPAEHLAHHDGLGLDHLIPRGRALRFAQGAIAKRRPRVRVHEARLGAMPFPPPRALADVRVLVLRGSFVSRIAATITWCMVGTAVYQVASESMSRWPNAVGSSAGVVTNVAPLFGAAVFSPAVLGFRKHLGSMTLCDGIVGGFDQGEPEGHLQLTQEVAGGGERPKRVMSPATRLVEKPEPKMTMRLKETHAELLGEIERLPVIVSTELERDVQCHLTQEGFRWSRPWS